MEEDHNPVASMIGFASSDSENVPDDQVLGPFPLIDEVLQCQISQWYSIFSNLPDDQPRKNVTISTIFIDKVPSTFREYILSDGVRLPLDATILSSCAPRERTKDEEEDVWSSDDENENEDDELSDDCSQPPQQFHFPELNQQIQQAITSLGGAVIPKLNWSTPKDASWVNCGTIKCKTPGDIYLLIKSSDFCLHDVLLHALKDCQDYQNKTHNTNENNGDDGDVVDTETNNPPPLQLALRKWCNLHPSMEFRCFVRRHELLAISQRNHTQHYPHLMHDWPRLRDEIIDFFDETIRHRFANATISNYVFDVYLDKKDRVWILDFNPWSCSTDSLLFEWSELLTLDEEDDPHVRIVETNNQVRQDPLASYRAPIDTVNLASMTGGDASQFEEFMKKCQKPSSL